MDTAQPVSVTHFDIYMFANGCNVEYGTNGRTPRSRVLDIFLLVRHKKIPELHHVMADSEFNIECRDENGNTPLIVAAQNGK